MKLPRNKHTAESDIYKRLSSNKEEFSIAITEELAAARQEIEDAYLNFQNSLDPDLIDCYIYKGNAAWKKYRFLLRQAKLAE